MHRNQLCKLLENYEPTKEEIGYKQEMLHFLSQYPQCFDRSLQIGHFTASAFLINFDGSQALLLHHAKLNRWLQLGGHADGNPDLLAVALQEACEESGLSDVQPISEKIFDIDVHQIPAHKDIPAHIHYDVRFFVQLMSDQVVQKNHESYALQWFEKHAILPTQERSVMRLFEKWQLL